MNALADGDRRLYSFFGRRISPSRQRTNFRLPSIPSGWPTTWSKKASSLQWLDAFDTASLTATRKLRSSIPAKRDSPFFARALSAGSIGSAVPSRISHDVRMPNQRPRGSYLRRTRISGSELAVQAVPGHPGGRRRQKSVAPHRPSGTG